MSAKTGSVGGLGVAVDSGSVAGMSRQVLDLVGDCPLGLRRAYLWRCESGGIRFGARLEGFRGVCRGV